MKNNIIQFPNPTRQDFLKDVTIQLIRLRKKLGLTQEEVNYRIGVSDRLVGKWECGLRTPSAFHLFCWAQVLGARILIVENIDNNPLSANDNQTPYIGVHKALNKENLTYARSS